MRSDVIGRFTRASWHLHLSAAIFCAAAVGAGVCALYIGLTQRLLIWQTERRELEHQQADLERRPVAIPAKRFNAMLPASQGTDELVQFLIAQAKLLNVQISTLSVQRSPASESQLGRVQLQLSLRGGYSDVKNLLAGLLERYASLGVQTLALQERLRDATQPDAELSLVWYVKD